MAWCVYIVQCGDGSFYTGMTNNLERRIAAHNTGKAARYTASRLPVVLAWSQVVPDRSTALREEYRIKQLSRDQKILLIAQPSSP